MSLFGSNWSSKRPGLEPDWMVTLPPRLTQPAVDAPRALLSGERLLVWGDGLAVAIDVASGAELCRVKLGSWQPAGPDADGRLVLQRKDGARTAILDVDSAVVAEVPGLAAAVPRSAQDDAERPEEDPSLRVGDRLYRVRSETRSRVTRHWIEATHFGTAPQRVEVASFTLRSNRLVLTDRGGRIYGWVGNDPECPAGAVVGNATGPVLVLRRRYPNWHEHTIPVTEPDLVGHGPAHLGVMIIVPGEAMPRGRELGTVPETWEGLGNRSSLPPYVADALGARPIGLAAGKIVVELTALDDGSPEGNLSPKQRYIAAFSSADLIP